MARLASLQRSIKSHTSLIVSLQGIVQKLTDDIARACQAVKLWQRQSAAVDRQANALARLTSKISIIQKLTLEALNEPEQDALPDSERSHTLRKLELDENFALLARDYRDLDEGLIIARQDLLVTRQYLQNAANSLQRAVAQKTVLLDLLKVLSNSVKALEADSASGVLRPDFDFSAPIQRSPLMCNACLITKEVMPCTCSLNRCISRTVLAFCPQSKNLAQNCSLAQLLAQRVEWLSQDIQASKQQTAALEHRAGELGKSAVHLSEPIFAQKNADPSDEASNRRACSKLHQVDILTNANLKCDCFSRTATTDTRNGNFISDALSSGWPEIGIHFQCNSKCACSTKLAGKDCDASAAAHAPISAFERGDAGCITTLDILDFHAHLTLQLRHLRDIASDVFNENGATEPLQTTSSEDVLATALIHQVSSGITELKNVLGGYRRQHDGNQWAPLPQNVARESAMDKTVTCDLGAYLDATSEGSLEPLTPLPSVAIEHDAWRCSTSAHEARDC